MAVGAAVALDADGADVGEQHDRELPDVAVEAGAGELLAGDRVGLAQDVEPLAGDLADDPDAEARARERVPPDDLGGQAELLADQPDLVLEQGAQRLDQLELEVVGQPADVVVGLDVGGAGAAAGLDHVGVERALHEERDLVAVAPPTASPRISASAASKTRMNSRPMILRFSSGSVTPASASRNCFSASTTCRSTPVAATKSRSTCSASPLRSSPWSTNTQVSRSPIARCTSAAATAESTPPESPQIACRGRRSGSRICSICSSTMLTIVQVGRQPAMSCRKCSSTCWPCSVCSTSGCHCTPASRRSSVLEGRDRGDVGGRRARRSPPGAAATESPWDIQTLCVAGGRRAGCRASETVDRRCGRTRARRCGRPRRRGPAPSAGSRSTCRRPGTPAVEERGVDAGRALGVDRRRAAGQDDRLRAAGPASPRPAWCAARSRSRPAPRAPGGRSAGRTAPRSRRRGPDRAQRRLLVT